MRCDAWQQGLVAKCNYNNVSAHALSHTLTNTHDLSHTLTNTHTFYTLTKTHSFLHTHKYTNINIFTCSNL